MRPSGPELSQRASHVDGGKAAAAIMSRVLIAWLVGSSGRRKQRVHHLKSASNASRVGPHHSIKDDRPQHLNQSALRRVATPRSTSTPPFKQVSNTTLALLASLTLPLWRFTPTSTALAVIMIDLTSLMLSMLHTALQAPHFAGASAAQFAAAYSIPLISAITVLYALRLYDVPELLKALMLGRLVVSTSIAALTLPSILLLSGAHIDGFAPWFILYWASSTFAVVLGRTLFTKIINHCRMRGSLRPRVAIIGATDLGKFTFERLSQRPSEVEVVGLFDDRASTPERTAATAVRGTVSDLVSLARQGAVERILIALPLTAGPRIATLSREFHALPIDVSVRVDPRSLQLAVSRRADIDDLATLRLFKCPLKPSDLLVKAISDKIIAAIGGMLLLPIFLLIAVAIKLDSNGPILFRQKRYGYKNSIFEIYKFRTMYADCTDSTGAHQARYYDQRVTRIGHFLRKLSLDELPQLLNVLRGDMSMVGPRPHPIAMTAGGVSLPDAAEDYLVRHRVKPGLTGWAQVNGWRGETDTVEKLKQRTAHDTFYVEHWSVGFDFEILARTLVTVLGGKNAV